MLVSHFLIAFPKESEKNVIPEEPFVSINWWREMSSLIWEESPPPSFNSLCLTPFKLFHCTSQPSLLGSLFQIMVIGLSRNNHFLFSHFESRNVVPSIFVLFLFQQSLTSFWNKGFHSLLWTSFTFVYSTHISSPPFRPNHARFALCIILLEKKWDQRREPRVGDNKRMGPRLTSLMMSFGALESGWRKAKVKIRFTGTHERRMDV